MKTTRMSNEALVAALNAMKEAALDPNAFGGAWFNNEEEYEDWAGDVLLDLFLAGCEALNITFDFEE